MQSWRLRAPGSAWRRLVTTMMDRPNIRTSRDLLNLPNFVEFIDPIARPLRRIVTPYFLDFEYPCGLKSCRQPHREGYLVELVDGSLTNVGRICGGHFGDAFAIEELRYSEQVQRPELIASLRIVAQRIRDQLQTLNNLERQAVNLSNCKSGFRKAVPKLHKELERRAHTLATPVSPITSSEANRRSRISWR